jgi:erythromycin esterase-like protein
MSRQGELNIGQLARETYGTDAYAIGFTTYSGSVTAAQDWDGEAEQRRVRPGMEGSFEALFHDSGLSNFLVFTKDLPPVQLLERAIGVIYRPETERRSHYFESDIASQFDAVIHIDQTSALVPTEPAPSWARDELLRTDSADLAHPGL